MDQQPEKTDRAHVWVKGRVQGVGFRAHVEYFARRMNITGWVRNVGYDTVEAVAEGKKETLDRFIEMMKQGPRGSHVEETRLEWEPASGEYDAFEVHRSM